MRKKTLLRALTQQLGIIFEEADALLGRTQLLEQRPDQAGLRTARRARHHDALAVLHRLAQHPVLRLGQNRLVEIPIQRERLRRMLPQGHRQPGGLGWPTGLDAPAHVRQRRVETRVGVPPLVLRLMGNRRQEAVEVGDAGRQALAHAQPKAFDEAGLVRVDEDLNHRRVVEIARPTSSRPD